MTGHARPCDIGYPFQYVKQIDIIRYTIRQMMAFFGDVAAVPRKFFEIAALLLNLTEIFVELVNSINFCPVVFVRCA